MPAHRPKKRRRLESPLDDGAVSQTVQSKDLFNHLAERDLEGDYNARIQRKKKTETTRLPTKSVEGRIEHAQVTHEDLADSDSFLGSGSEDGLDGDLETPPTSDTDTKPQIPLKDQIISAKEEIARLAGMLNEDPEEHAGAFKKLAQVGGHEAHENVQKLALAAQAAVYKDVIPGYRIRAYKDEELGNQVSKDVRQAREYEQALVTGYQQYVRRLSSLCKSKNDSPSQADLKTVALSCACTLLRSVPHFNFRTELLNILINEVGKRQVTPDYIKALETLEAFFDDDEDGAPSLEAVGLLAKMMKAKDYRIREEALNVFFHLRLLSEMSIQSRNTGGDSNREGKIHGRKVKQERKQHMSKKERKIAKERRAVEKDMLQADASVNYEERDKMQSETLKLVFVIYFRILKARIPHLTGAVLEGLAKYAHLINQDLFGDILEALKDIIGQAEAAENDDELEEAMEDTFDSPDDVRNRTRESLLATQTAFTLLSNQEVSKSASELHLDLSFFTSHIYRSLHALTVDPDIELGPKSLRLPDPHTSAAPSRVNISTPVLLLTRAITSILLTPSQPPPTISALAFFKRLLTASLQLPEKSTLAVLNLMSKVADKHGRKIEPLWYSDERKGDGVYRGESETVEGTNVLAVGSGVWEEELLRRHYCPQIREGVKSIDKLISSLHR